MANRVRQSAAGDTTHGCSKDWVLDAEQSRQRCFDAYHFPFPRSVWIARRPHGCHLLQQTDEGPKFVQNRTVPLIGMFWLWAARKTAPANQSKQRPGWIGPSIVNCTNGYQRCLQQRRTGNRQQPAG